MTDDAAPAADSGLRILKKYPNRRLYDTQTSSYITLADVKRMVLSGENFEVRDAKTSEDLTRSILLQIILEEETGGMPMFTTQSLSQIIRFYGHAMQGLMGNYLERNLQTFVEMQARLTDPKSFTPEGWAQLMSGGLMTSYLEHNKKLMEQLQEQMKKQPAALFPGFPLEPKE